MRASKAVISSARSGPDQESARMGRLVGMFPANLLANRKVAYARACGPQALLSFESGASVPACHGGHGGPPHSKLSSIHARTGALAQWPEDALPFLSRLNIAASALSLLFR